MTNKKNINIYAVIIKLIGWLTMIAGLVLGVIFAKNLAIYPNIETWIFIGYFTGGVVLGSFILGFGEIIQLLEDIKNK